GSSMASVLQEGRDRRVRPLEVEVRKPAPDMDEVGRALPQHLFGRHGVSSRTMTGNPFGLRFALLAAAGAALSAVALGIPTASIPLAVRLRGISRGCRVDYSAV